MSDVVPIDSKTSARRLASNPQRTITAGGQRAVIVKVKIPLDQYDGLQRFKGDTDADKINTIVRMANKRVDAVAAEAQRLQTKAVAPLRMEDVAAALEMVTNKPVA